jgi:transmembrane sensor
MQDPLENIQDLEKAAELIARHIRGELSDPEKKALEAWVGADKWHQAYFEQCASPAYLDQIMADYHKAAGLEDELRAEIRLRIGHPADQEVTKIASVHRIHFLKRPWFRVAAAILLIVITGACLWYSRSTYHPEIAAAQTTPIAAGRQGAILTLADGKQLILDSLTNGVVADQNGSQAAIKNGQLAYHPIVPATNSITYNTITTPRGRQYQLELPDGTKVWLNAASRITFPTTFTGSERKVMISGEAYFEVARKADRPFKVSAAGANIEVLGTSFNIAAYSDEANVKATLLEGSVKVWKEGAGAILKPGQQAVIGDQVRVDSNVNIEQVIAWKNGLFYFSRTDLSTVMKQLSRWYDIDVKYEDKVPDINLTGKMDKGLNLNEIREFLTKMEVKHKLLGRTVIVSN